MKKFFKRFSVVEGSDVLINILTIVLAIFGLVMAISASMQASTNSTVGLITTSVKEIIFFTISYVFMVILSKVFNYKLARRLIMPASLLMILLLLSTRLFGETNGAYAWIRIGAGSAQFTIQPAEFAKVSTTVLMAVYLGDVSLHTKRSSWEIISPVFWVVLVQFIIILVPQKDLGSAVILFLITYFIFLIPSHPRLTKYQNRIILLSVLGFFGIVFLLTDTGILFVEKLGILKGFQLDRFKDFANPFRTISTTGYQLAGSLISFSRGGWFGVGLGQSVQKYGYLPEADTDFILPLIAEELGFVGVAFILIIYALLLYRLTYYALKVKSEKDKMILMGTVLYLFFHLLLNIGGVSVSIPLTGVPLLLISSGGSSTMATMSAIGISQSIISKHKKRMNHENR